MGNPRGIINGKSYWKLNRLVLCEDGFRDKYIEKYSLWQTLKPVYENPVEWLESVKCRTKDFCIQYCIKLSRIKTLSEKLDELISVSADRAELERVKTEIKSLNES